MHYPTDINLLWDPMRKLIEVIAGLCGDLGMTEWRQSAYQLRQFKNLFRQVQRLKHSTAKDPEKRAAKQEAVRQPYCDYTGGRRDLVHPGPRDPLYLAGRPGTDGLARTAGTISAPRGAPDRPEPAPGLAGADDPA